MKNNTRLAVLCSMLAAAMLSTQAQAQPEPGPGNDTAVERRAILAALRPAIVRRTHGPVEFVVESINVSAGWALAKVQPQRPGGHTIDPATFLSATELEFADGTGVEALLRRRGGRWQLVQQQLGATDVWYMCFPGAPAALVGHCDQ
jgi:hypothetical protein